MNSKSLLGRLKNNEDETNMVRLLRSDFSMLSGMNVKVFVIYHKCLQLNVYSFSSFIFIFCCII